MSGTVTLADLLGEADFVETSRGRLEIRGLGVGEILRLVTKYPVLSAQETGVSISIPALLESAPEAVPEIIAIACEMPGKDGIRASRRLSASDQATVLTAIVERSLPDGPAPFVEKVATLMSLLRGS